MVSLLEILLKKLSEEIVKIAHPRQRFALQCLVHQEDDFRFRGIVFSKFPNRERRFLSTFCLKSGFKKCFLKGTFLKKVPQKFAPQVRF